MYLILMSTVRFETLSVIGSVKKKKMYLAEPTESAEKTKDIILKVFYSISSDRRKGARDIFLF